MIQQDNFESPAEIAAYIRQAEGANVSAPSNAVGASAFRPTLAYSLPTSWPAAETYGPGIVPEYRSSVTTIDPLWIVAALLALWIMVRK